MSAKPGPLTERQANLVEAEMRSLESDRHTSPAAMRLFMQSPMPCGHAAGNLLTCDTQPFGCVICNSAEPAEPPEGLRAAVEGALCNCALRARQRDGIAPLDEEHADWADDRCPALDHLEPVLRALLRRCGLEPKEDR